MNEREREREREKETPNNATVINKSRRRMIRLPVLRTSSASASASSLRLLLLAAAALLVLVQRERLVATAHRPALQNGQAGCGDDFGSSTTALSLPDPSISWSFKHYLDCTHRAVWISFQNTSPPSATSDDGGEEGTLFYVGVGVPTLPRFEDVRADALIIGPGLPPLDDATFRSLPESIRSDPVWTASSGGDIGAYFHQSPQEQSTCEHLGTVMKGESTIVEGRCDFFEPFGQTHSWRVLDADDNFIPSGAGDGTYHVAVWLQNNTSAKIGIALGTWVEDFITPYGDIPTPTCARDFLSDFSEKSGSQEECFPVVSCPSSGPIGCVNGGSGDISDAGTESSGGVSRDDFTGITSLKYLMVEFALVWLYFSY